MVDAVTKHWIPAYRPRLSPTRFLTGLLNFNPSVHVHDSEKVTIDIMREDESVSIVMPDQAGGYRDVTAEQFSNKEFRPPAYADKHSVNSWELRKRQFNQSPFDDVDVVRNAATETARNMAAITNRMQRAVELQASQVLQTGQLTLTDASGATLYTIDYGPKATHFPTVGVAWSNAAADVRGDLISLAKVIRRNGQAKPNNVIMGEDAIEWFLANDRVKEDLNFRRADVINIAPVSRGDATYHGRYNLGDYKFDIWTYDGEYKDPQSGNMTPYVGADKVIMFAAASEGGFVQTRIDLTFGRYRPIRPPLPEARRFLPGSMVSGSGMFSLDMNAWFTDDGMTLMAGGGTRPLVIPVGIDTFGCLDVNP